ncbi:MAG: antirestriction protein ArdA, partial [Bacteroidota bacterium]
DYPDLFRALAVSQSTLHLWFEHFESMREGEVSRCLHLAMNKGMGIEEISQYDLEDIQLFLGSAKEYADSYLEENGLLEQVPECLRDFIDTSAYAQDMLLNGALKEFSVDTKMYVVLQNS